jgi:hypothetical protein
MGFLAKRRQRRAQEDYEHALALWQQEDAELKEMTDTAATFRGTTEGASLQLHDGERVYHVLHGAALIEPRRERGHYEGGYSGFSFRVAKGVRYHVGGTRGTYVQGAEVPTPIDTGTVTITNRRVVFEGSKQAREWDYSKLLGHEDHTEAPWTALPVSNRQKVSGFLYDAEHAPEIRFRLGLALADFNNTTDDFAKHVQQELAEHQSARPQPPLPA